MDESEKKERNNEFTREFENFFDDADTFGFNKEQAIFLFGELRKCIHYASSNKNSNKK